MSLAEMVSVLLKLLSLLMMLMVLRVTIVLLLTLMLLLILLLVVHRANNMSYLGRFPRFCRTPLVGGARKNPRPAVSGGLILAIESHYRCGSTRRWAVLIIIEDIIHVGARNWTTSSHLCIFWIILVFGLVCVASLTLFFATNFCVLCCQAAACVVLPTPRTYQTQWPCERIRHTRACRDFGCVSGSASAVFLFVADAAGHYSREILNKKGTSKAMRWESFFLSAP